MNQNASYSVRYGGADLNYVDYEKARIIIVPVPYEAMVTYRKGTKNGPLAIIEASGNMELYDEELDTETYKAGIHTMPPLDVEKLSPSEMIKVAHKTVKDILTAGKFPVLIGGEHTISVGTAKAAKEAVGDISILTMDAHYDLRNEYKGSKNSHACVARRLQAAN